MHHDLLNVFIIVYDQNKICESIWLIQRITKTALHKSLVICPLKFFIVNDLDLKGIKLKSGSKVHSRGPGVMIVLFLIYVYAR